MAWGETKKKARAEGKAAIRFDVITERGARLEGVGAHPPRVALALSQLLIGADPLERLEPLRIREGFSMLEVCLDLDGTGENIAAEDVLFEYDPEGPNAEAVEAMVRLVNRLLGVGHG